jgi:hypothetical protein
LKRYECTFGTKIVSSIIALQVVSKLCVYSSMSVNHMSVFQIVVAGAAADNCVCPDVHHIAISIAMRACSGYWFTVFLAGKLLVYIKVRFPRDTMELSAPNLLKVKNL